MNISDIPLRKSLRILTAILLVAVTIYILYLFFDLVVMLVISLLIALIFNPVVTFFEKRKMPRLVAVLLVLLGTTVIILTALSVLIPKVVAQMNAISASLNREDINQFFTEFQKELQNYVPFLDTGNLVNKVNDVLSSFVLGSLNNLSSILTSIFSILAISIIVPFMTFFLLKDKTQIIKGIINLVPNKYFEMSYWVIRKVANQLGRYVSGWILDAFIVGSAVALGLTILGIKNSITIGLIAGIGHLIPYFGPVIGGIPAITISLIQFGDFSMFPSIALLFLVIYSFDNGYVQPKVFSMSTDFHPLAIIILILMGGQLLGVLGMLLAVPTATVIKTAAREIYFAFKQYKIIKL